MKEPYRISSKLIFGQFIFIVFGGDFVTVIGVKTLPADVRKEANIMIELLEENKRDWAHVDPPFDYKIVG